MSEVDPSPTFAEVAAAVDDLDRRRGRYAWDSVALSAEETIRELKTGGPSGKHTPYQLAYLCKCVFMLAQRASLNLGGQMVDEHNREVTKYGYRNSVRLPDTKPSDSPIPAPQPSACPPYYDLSDCKDVAAVVRKFNIPFMIAEAISKLIRAGHRPLRGPDDKGPESDYRSAIVAIQNEVSYLESLKK